MTTDVQQEIRAIQLYTKRLMQANLFGQSRSLQKGHSLEFDQIRDYQLGDDIRSIDWNSSARSNKLLVKQFFDERQRSILVALDISASSFYGSDSHLKITIARKIAAILSYAAFLGKDEIGLMLFTDSKEWYIPPRSGKAHVLQILEKIFSFTPVKRRTDIGPVLDTIMQLKKKNMMLFLISDFIDTDFQKQLAIVGRKFDTIAIHTSDQRESDFNASGLITMQDCETDQEYIVKVGPALNGILQQRAQEQKKMFIKSGADLLEINFSIPVFDQLINFFQLRSC